MSLSVDPRIGSELFGYRVEALLGRGGMSVVYRAHDLALDRKVALKLLASELAGDDRFRARFLRESRVAASLDHPNVVPIYEAGEAEGLLCIAMRYVEGTDLKRLLREEGALEPDRALDYCAQVAAALDAAHEHGLVHRDVKPSNVLITRSGALLPGRLRPDLQRGRSERPDANRAPGRDRRLRRSRADRGQGGGRPRRRVLARLPALRVPRRLGALREGLRPGGAVGSRQRLSSGSRLVPGARARAETRNGQAPGRPVSDVRRPGHGRPGSASKAGSAP